MNWLRFGSLVLLFVYTYAVKPPDKNPGKFGHQVEGDMVFSNFSGVNSGSHAFRGNEKWIWPDGNVFYRLAPTIKADETRSFMIREAMDDITREAPCVNFIDIENKDPAPGAFVDIVTYGDAELKLSALGCHSEVGYQGRRQIINLQPDDCFHSATIKHELFHTLGCVHEHSRPDVAEALEILINNVHPNMRKNFEVGKYDYEDINKGLHEFSTPYDIMSIMQYPAHAFAINDSLKTMVSKDPAFEDSFGYSEDFSVIDIVELNLRYNCTLKTSLVFNYLHAYMDIIISRRKMDRLAIAKLENQSEIDQRKIDHIENQDETDQEKILEMENQITKLEDESKIDKQKISKLEDQSRSDKEKLRKLEDQVKVDQERLANLEILLHIGCVNGITITNLNVGGRMVQVRCEDTWIVIQRRGQYNNARDYFLKSFSQYENGFGSVDNELWIGLKNMADLTKEGQWQLRVDLTDWEGNTYFALYDSFAVGPGPRYQLTVSGFDDVTSTLSDCLSYNHGMAFSTESKDQDEYGSNCASMLSSAWWYKSCSYSNLNGLNFGQQENNWKGMVWEFGKGIGSTTKTYRESVMKIRRISI